MATVGVTHRKVVTIPDDPGYPVGTSEWNDTHVITGLENVDNTSDMNKPVSTAQAAALALKQDAAAFTNTTPTPASVSGTLTTASSSIDAMSLGGMAYLIVVTVSITSVGSGSGNITLTLPVTPSKSGALMGQCINNGKTISGVFAAGSSTMTITNYDATSPIGSAQYVLMGIVKV